MSCGALKGRGISGLVPWFGGKRAMAPLIVEQLCWRGGKPWTPAYFCEPFFGSGAVSFAMPEVPAHTVNDLHEDLINLARVLASKQGEDLLGCIERTLCSEAVYTSACHTLAMIKGDAELPPGSEWHPYEMELAWAWAFAVASWLGPNGQIGMADAAGGGESKPRFAKRYGPGGGDPATRLRSYAESLPVLMERLRRMTILNEDAIGLVEKIQDTPRTALYIDSPYLDATRTSGKYRHDFDDAGGATMFGVPDDHERLSDALNRFEHARIVVSYEDHPRLAELYPPSTWTKIVLNRHKNLSVAGGVGGGGDSARVDEVLLVNGDVKHDGGGS